MSFSYHLFGFSVLSNVLLPGLTPTSTKPAEITLLIGSRPLDPPINDQDWVLSYTSLIPTAAGEPCFQLFQNLRFEISRLSYHEGSTFWLDLAGGRIYVTWPAGVSFENVAACLLGPVFALFLRLRGTPCLHASAIACDRRAVLFAGNTGMGKSTTAAALTMRGFSAISDDIVALQESKDGFLAIPSVPYVSLWPESVKLLRAENSVVAPSANDFLKYRYVPSCFESSPRPIRHIFAFQDRGEDGDVPKIVRLSPADALMALVAASYATTLLSKEHRMQEFAALSQIAKAVPVYNLYPGDSRRSLEPLCDLIETTIGGQ